MLKSYADFLKQISAHDLFEGILGYGMFADKLPPCFTSVPLYQFYERRKGQNLERRTWHNYIVFDSQECRMVCVNKIFLSLHKLSRSKNKP